MHVQQSLKDNIQRVVDCAKLTDQDVKDQLNEISNQPSAFWIDTRAKIADVKTILDSMTKGQGVVLIVYDLPNRDCAALSSNGELCCSQTEACKSFCNTECQTSATDCDIALKTYTSEYIDALYDLFKEYPDLKLVLIIEPDSIPNCVTNYPTPCTDVTCTTYITGITYALETFSKLSNTTMYLDAAHGGWLGWDNNLTGYYKIVSNNNWNQYLRGFATNVSNYQQLGDGMCEFPLTNTDYNAIVTYVKSQPAKGQCGYDPCGLTTQFNAGTSELNYVRLLYWKFQDLPFRDGKPFFVIDTGRSGNPDARMGTEACKTWCNVKNARIGVFPTTDTAADFIDAYFWLKTPGESDGCIDRSIQKTCSNDYGVTCVRYDPNCGTHPENIGYATDEPCPPEAGAWFDYQILMLAGAENPEQYVCLPSSNKNYTVIQRPRSR